MEQLPLTRDADEEHELRSHLSAKSLAAVEHARGLAVDLPEASGFEDADHRSLIEATRYLRSARMPSLKPLLPLLLSLKGKPYTLDDHFPFEPFFRTRVAKTTVLMTARQVSKSTSLASQGLLVANSIPFFSTLFVTPLFEMIRRFSHQYVREFIERSPIKKLFMDAKTMNSVLQRSFLNGSTLIFSFAFLDAERTRGVPADKNCLVEGTPVELGDGSSVSIEDAIVGSEVVSVDEDGRVVCDVVTEKIYQGEQATYVVEFDNGAAVCCTADERFMTAAGSWFSLAELQGSPPVLLRVRGNHTTECGTASIVSVKYAGERRVWDLNTEKHHAFFAGGVLVHNCIDEIQDLHHEFLQIIHETLSGSPYGLKQYAGTPKSFDNTIQQVWEDSSQAEWLIKCRAQGCGHWNVPAATHDLIEMTGPWHADISEETPGTVCAKCVRPINPRQGRWVHAYPERRWDYAGYHVPQQIMPMHYGNNEKWGVLVGKMQGRYNTTPTTFLNEVCGTSSDAGSKMVTESDLKNAAVLPWRNNWREGVKNLKNYTRRVLAVDWGGGGGRLRSSNGKEGEKRLRTSFTTLSVLGYRPDGKIDCIWGHRSLTSHDWEGEAKLCIEAVEKFRCSHIVQDYGGAGSGRVTFFVQAGFPIDSLINVRYQGPAKQGIMVLSPPTEDHNFAVYDLDKSRSLGITCQALKYGLLRFFQYDFVSADQAGLMRDFLALYEEITTSLPGTSQFYIGSNPNKSDDFAQATNIGCCALWYMNESWPNIAEAAKFKIPAHVLKSLHPAKAIDWGGM